VGAGTKAGGGGAIGIQQEAKVFSVQTRHVDGYGEDALSAKMVKSRGNAPEGPDIRPAIMDRLTTSREQVELLCPEGIRRNQAELAGDTVNSGQHRLALNNEGCLVLAHSPATAGGEH
jgi:hypothetical protein